MLSTDAKMYELAKHFEDLNEKGKVKGFRANERGYVRVLNVVRGCTLLLLHSGEDELSINLLITSNALTRHEVTCKKAIERFKDYLGRDVVQKAWSHSLDASERLQYGFDLSNRSLSEIICLTSELKNKMLPT